MRKIFLATLFLLPALAALGQLDQFRIIGTGSWTTVNDSTFSAVVTFSPDLTGNSFLPTGITDTMRVFSQRGQVYRVDTVYSKTFSNATMKIVERGGNWGKPLGQVMVYDHENREEVPNIPFGSTGSTAQFQASVDTYNSRLGIYLTGVVSDSTRSMQDSILIYYQNGSEVGRDTLRPDLSSYLTGTQTRQEVSDSIANFLTATQIRQEISDSILIDSISVSQDSILTSYRKGVEISRDTIRSDLSNYLTAIQIRSEISDSLLVDSTRLTQDSILVYYQDGSEIGRDTIGNTGGGGSGGGGHIIADDGSGVTARDTLNFSGGGFTVADDGTKTNVTLNIGLNVENGDTTYITHKSNPVTNVFKNDQYSTYVIDSTGESKLLEINWDTSQNNVRVLLWAVNQSNGAGVADTTGSMGQWLDQTDSVYIWNSVYQRFEPYNLREWNNMSLVGKHGLDLWLQKWWPVYYDAPLYIIKYAIGSSSITSWKPGGANFQHHRDYFWVNAINKLITQGKTPYVSMLHFQGETDKADTAAYRLNLDTTLAYYRKIFPTAPYYICEIADVDAAAQNMNNFFADYASEKDDIYVLENSGLSSVVHFDSEDFDTIAHLLILKMIESGNPGNPIHDYINVYPPDYAGNVYYDFENQAQDSAFITGYYSGHEYRILDSLGTKWMKPLTTAYTPPQAVYGFPTTPSTPPYLVKLQQIPFGAKNPTVDFELRFPDDGDANEIAVIGVLTGSPLFDPNSEYYCYATVQQTNNRVFLRAGKSGSTDSDFVSYTITADSTYNFRLSVRSDTVVTFSAATDINRTDYAEVISYSFLSSQIPDSGAVVFGSWDANQDFLFDNIEVTWEDSDYDPGTFVSIDTIVPGRGIDATTIGNTTDIAAEGWTQKTGSYVVDYETDRKIAIFASGATITVPSNSALDTGYELYIQNSSNAANNTISSTNTMWARGSSSTSITIKPGQIAILTKRSDGAWGVSWPGSGEGTVTSAGLALPTSIMSVTGSPVTSSGTLTGNLKTQSANLVWAGPTSGGAANPTFRALVTADMPYAATLTEGSVLFAGATGNITQNNDNFFWSNSSIRLGIGTKTPATSLHINRTDGIIPPAGTKAQRSVSPTNFEFRGQTDDGSGTIEWYNSTDAAWWRLPKTISNEGIRFDTLSMRYEWGDTSAGTGNLNLTKDRFFFLEPGVNVNFDGTPGTDHSIFYLNANGQIWWGANGTHTGTDYLLNWNPTTKAFYLGDAISGSLTTADNSISMGKRNRANGVTSASIGGTLNNARAVSSGTFAGQDLDVDAQSTYGVSIGGRQSDMDSTLYGFMGGGLNNRMLNSYAGVIIGGDSSFVSSGSIGPSVLIAGTKDSLGRGYGNGILGGVRNRERGNFAFTLGGQLLYNKSSYALTIGLENVKKYDADSTGWTATDPIFTIGKGFNGKQNNGLTFTKQGRMQINSLLDTTLIWSDVAPDNTLHIVAASDPLKLEGLQENDAQDSILAVDIDGVVYWKTDNNGIISDLPAGDVTIGAASNDLTINNAAVLSINTNSSAGITYTDASTGDIGAITLTNQGAKIGWTDDDISESNTMTVDRGGFSIGPTTSGYGSVTIDSLGYFALRDTSAHPVAGDLGEMYFNTTDSIAFISDGANWRALTLDAMSLEQDTTINAEAWKLHPVDVTNIAATVNPPGSPFRGMWFSVSDSRGNAASNNITIDFTTASDKFHGASATNYVMGSNFEFKNFVYVDDDVGWIIAN